MSVFAVLEKLVFCSAAGLLTAWELDACSEIEVSESLLIVHRIIPAPTSAMSAKSRVSPFLSFFTGGGSCMASLRNAVFAPSEGSIL